MKILIKTTIVITLLSANLYVLFYLLSMVTFKVDKIALISENDTTLFRIIEISSPLNSLWINNETLAITESDNTFSLYDVNNRIVINKTPLRQNSIVGKSFTSEEIFICQWENKKIFNANEFATYIHILNEENTEINSIKTHETISLFSCNENQIIAKTAFDFLEQSFYQIDVKSGDIKAIESIPSAYILNDSNLEQIIVYKQDKILFQINKINNITSFSISPDEKSIALITSNNEIFIYK